MNILITGGCGYVGTILTKQLLKLGHSIAVLDKQWFGNYLEPSANLVLIKEDILNIDKVSLDGFDCVIHLANIANDPAVDLDQTLSWEVNVLASQQLADKIRREKVKHLIYASSGSVYGIKEEPEVTEDLSLVPISVYNKTKIVAERVFLSYQDHFQVHCIRPATVCGYSPRMRLDVSVNMLTYQALSKNKITVFGGKQTRPNINIHDMVRVYQHFLEKPSLPSGAYNAGFENLSILAIAKKIQEKTSADIVFSNSDDPRSYRQNSDKLLQTGFSPKFDVNDAINEITEKYNQHQIEDRDEYYTIKMMKKILSQKKFIDGRRLWEKK